MQWHIAAVVVSCLWFGALPLILYTAVYLNQGMGAVWTILPLSYATMQFLLVYSYIRVDWKSIGERKQPETPLEPEDDIEMESVNLITRAMA